jgi:predicted HTH domain antitoxin
MTITLDLEPEMETRLQTAAQERGVPIQDYLLTLVENALTQAALEEAIRLYTERKMTQGQAAALAGLSRAEFIEALNRAGVSVFQYETEDELIAEVTRA